MSDASSSTERVNHSRSVKVPWHPLLAVFVVVAVFVVAQALAGLVVSIYPTVHHWTAAQAKDWLSSSLYGQFFFVAFATAITIGTVYQFIKLFKCNWQSIGFRRPKFMDVGAGLASGLLYYPVYFVAIGLTTWLVPSINTNQAQQLGFSPQGVFQLVLTFIALVLLPPIMEETLFRGFLYTSLRKSMRVIYAAVITSVIFAIPHLQLGSGAPLLWVAAIDTFVLSLFLVWLREKTGSLWASMTLHVLKNGIAFFSLFVFHVR